MRSPAPLFTPVACLPQVHHCLGIGHSNTWWVPMCHCCRLAPSPARLLPARAIPCASDLMHSPPALQADVHNRGYENVPGGRIWRWQSHPGAPSPPAVLRCACLPHTLSLCFFTGARARRPDLQASPSPAPAPTCVQGSGGRVCPGPFPMLKVGAGKQLGWAVAAAAAAGMAD